MNRSTAHSLAGFTLVELLVVLAIIGILAGITVPAFVFGASRPGDEVRASAIDLSQTLRTAQVRATTFRRGSAVVYLPEFVDGAGVFLNHLFIARRLGNEDLAAEGFQDEDALRTAMGLPEAANDTVTLYLQLENERGIPRRMDGIGALYHVANEATYGNILSDTGGAERALGLTPVYVLNQEAFANISETGDTDPDTLLFQSTPRFLPWRTSATAFGDEVDAFPAHRFNNNGFMVTGSTIQRFRLPVCAQTDLQFVEDRFTERDDLATPPTFAQQLLGINVEVFAALGRVKVRTEYGPIRE